MKLRITASPLLLLAALFIGCGGHGHMRQLERLEAQLDTAPSVVRLALDSVPFASLGDEERALYAILRTQADYKCYVPLTSDTLIRHATNYYNRNRKSYRAAMAWYSLGCVYTEHSDDAAAVEAYLRAQTYFPDTTVRYHALCYQNLGRHYLNREMYDDALQSLRTCKQQSAIYGDSSTVGYCDYYIGCAYLYQKSYDSAEVYFDKVKCNIHSPEDCVDELDHQYAKIAYYRDGDFDKVLSHLYQCDNLHERAASLSYLADVFYSKQQYDSAYTISLQIQSLSNELHTQCWNYKRLAELSPLVGRHDSAMQYVAQYALLLDSVYRLRQQTEINAICNDLTLSHYRQQQARERFFHNILGLFVFVTVMLGVWLAFNKRENRLLKSNLRLSDELSRIRAALLYGTAKDSVYAEPSLSPDEVHAYYSRLYGACLLRYKQTSSYVHIQSLSLPFTKQQRDTILEDIRNSFADIVSTIHTATPSLSADMLLTCICLSLGYSTDVIADVFLISPQTIRSRKSRAKQELSAPVFQLLCGMQSKKSKQ